ncbi:MAG: putative glycolipid-binding domain-containing protein [Halobacteriota archaeon]
MAKILHARWTSWNNDSVENLVLKETGEDIVADSKITSRGTKPFTATYTIVCDRVWHTRHFRVDVDAEGVVTTLCLEGNGSGTWSDSSEIEESVDGAIDIDLTATPFTNTLPIRRLGLDEGQSQAITVAYVLIPELAVSAKRQRYTCLVENRRYRFEQIDDGFVTEMDIDENGLVMTYPGLFMRV